MIKKYYNIKCDCCGKMLSDFPFGSEYAALDEAKEAGWKHTRDDVHYCNDCWMPTLEETIITKDHKTFKEDEEYNSIIEEVTPTEHLPIGILMRSIDVIVAYCPECGQMIELDGMDETVTLPDGRTGIKAWCYNCETDFFAKD